jgi:hypothetical protein
MSNWWAERDTPIHTDSHVRYCVDARSTLFTMCCHFLIARHYIYLASWGMTPTMKLVRGTDHRARPDGSSEQEALLAELQAEGLGEAEIDFWRTKYLSDFSTSMPISPNIDLLLRLCLRLNLLVSWLWKGPRRALETQASPPCIHSALAYWGRVFA